MTAVTWLLVAAYTVLGAVALYPSAAMKATMGPVLMWAMAGLYALSGLACLVSPNAIRSAARSVLTPNAARIAGLAYLVVGAGLFRVAAATHAPLLAQIVGVIIFMEGGVQVLRPEVGITLTEWWIDQANGWYRAVGLLCFALAALFAWGAGPAKPAKPAPASITTPAESAAPVEPPATGLPPVLAPDAPETQSGPPAATVAP